MNYPNYDPEGGSYGLTLNDYQQQAKETAIYPDAGTGSARALSYVALGLAGEAGEVANKIKKILRDANGVVTPEHREMIGKELGDVLWYGAMLAREIHVPLDIIAGANLEKLFARKEAGTIGGSGDDR